MQIGVENKEHFLSDNGVLQKIKTGELYKGKLGSENKFPLKEKISLEIEQHMRLREVRF